MNIPRYLIEELPAGLQPLADAVANMVIDLRWTWSHAGDSVWKIIDPQAWEQTENPHVVLQNLTRERLEELDKDRRFKKRLERLAAAHKDYCNSAGWYDETHSDAGLKTIAYFSMEYGLGEALPLYAGGLGMLAGDHLKAASDLNVPVVGVGLLYQEGYFRQMLDASGWQQEIYPFSDSTGLPIRPVQAPSGAWLHVVTAFPGRSVRFRVWQARIGRVTLYLLDSNDPLNSPADRGITGKLYGGGQEMRLVQEIALGIGGWRALEALGMEIDVCHLNEGHAAFVTLERARRFMEQHDVNFWEALWATRVGNLFTTHTPVAAGFDTFERALVEKYGQEYAQRLGVTPDELAALGSKNPAKPNESFNMAYLAARTCGAINGVSRLHGKVSRRIFQGLYPHWPQQEVPVTHITNGVHVPSWDSPWADEIWTKACGKGRWLGTEEALNSAVEGQSDEALWTFRSQEREDLIQHARKRLARQLGQRGVDPVTVAQADRVLDPNVLTLGFARRFTEYKRPNLLLRDPQRFIRLLTNPDRPVQIIIAGKAHPQDEQGKRLVQEWAQFVQQTGVRAHAVFLEDYDISLAQELVQGVDVWINTPRRPWEACGTSGMKVLVNGGLNLSELDGWWAEAYTPEVGWSLGDGKEHSEPEWDRVEAEQLYGLLEDEVVPMFYDRDTAGIPRAWVARIRASMARLAPRFSTNRMVREYVEKLYLPAAAAFRHRSAHGAEAAKGLCHWDAQVRQHWHEVHWGNLLVSKEKDGWTFEIQIYLGEISPDWVQLQVYADPLDGEEAPVCEIMQRQTSIPGTLNGYLYRCRLSTPRPYTEFTPRILAYHPEARIPAENNLIQWWSGTVTFQRT